MSAFLHSDCVAAMVSIKEKLVISYDGSPECTIPSNLVTKLEDGDQKFLKLRPSSVALAQVICGGCSMKNPTFTHSPRLKELKDKLDQALLQASAEQHSPDDDGPELFGGQVPSNSLTGLGWLPDHLPHSILWQGNRCSCCLGGKAAGSCICIPEGGLRDPT